MTIEADIQAVLDDPTEPFETADQFVEATYLLFAGEMTDQPIAELWQEAVDGMRGADHDKVERSLDALDVAIAEAREKLRSIENGEAFTR